MAPRSPLAGSPITVPVAASAAILVLAALAPAQQQFAELGKQHLPADDENTSAIAVGDFDGDGFGDLVFANLSAQNRIYVKVGRGTFRDATSGRMPLDDHITVDLAAGDLDGDGDLDLVLANNTTQNRLYLNDGTGTFADFTALRIPPDADFTQAVALGDVDGDGDLDLVLGNAGSRRQNRLYLNDGTARFTDVTALRMPFDNNLTSAVALADVDGDRDLDVVFGNSGTFGQRQTRLYLNDGGGTFSDATVTRMPVDDGITSDLALGDVDGDGDVDLVLGSTGVAPRPQTRLYLNDGGGVFTDVTSARMPADGDVTSDVDLGDVDGDGDLDLLTGNSGTAGQRQDRLYLNDGTGTFSDATAKAMPADDTATAALAMTDADGDGDLDLVLGGAHDRLFLNDGDGVFVNASVRPLSPAGDFPRAVVLRDVDADGDLDAFIASFAGRNRLYLNDGHGSFADDTTARMPVDADRSTAAAAGDVDADGDVDVVFGNAAQQDTLYLNDGAGLFVDATAQRMPSHTDLTSAVLLADLDADGDLDLLLGNGQQDRLYVNDGTGTFTDATAARLPLRQGLTNALAVGDVDGDGDGDLVLGTTGPAGQRRTLLYLNDGTGVFGDATQGRMPFDDDVTFSVALGDVDGDDDLDLVIGNATTLNRLYLNDGTGTFSDATTMRMPASQRVTRSLALTDVDGDGDLDAVLAPIGPPTRSGLYVNDGAGFFTDAESRMPLHEDVTWGLAVGDVDGDGDRDLVFGNTLTSRVYLNLRRQLSAPLLARIGEVCRLDGYARFGPHRAADVILPFLSDKPASMAFPPFGILRLEPSRLVTLPPFLASQPAGVGSTSFVIPDLRGLVGMSWHAQAMLVPLPFPGALTNSTCDVIVDV